MNRTPSYAQRQRRLPARCVAACALAGLPLLAAAQATSSVTIYGLFDAAVRRASNVGAEGASRVSMDDGIFTGSRLGFRTREDLGGGLSALLAMESGFDPSTGASAQASPTADYGQVAAATRFWGREIYIGLRSTDGWGLSLGRQYTLAHQMTARFQPEGNPNSTAHSIFSSHHVARQDNMVKLEAKLAGVELAAARTLGEVAGNNGSDAWAVSAAYTAGPVSLGAYVQRLNNLADTEQRRIVGAGGNWKLTEAFTLLAGAMRRDDELSPQTNRVWTLGASTRVLPTVTISAAYLHDKQAGSARLAGKRKVAYVTASYAFSKRSDVYAVVDRNEVEGGYAKPAFMGTLGSQNGLVLGLRHRF